MLTKYNIFFINLNINTFYYKTYKIYIIYNEVKNKKAIIIKIALAIFKYLAVI